MPNKILHLLSKTALALAVPVLLLPASALAGNYTGSNAHEACKRDEDKRQVVGAAIGAVAGGVFGSQVSGRGARTEGSAIGAVIGGLAGAGIADKSVDCDPVYAPQTSSIYPTSTYSSSSYSTGSYPSTSYQSPTYSSGTAYSSGPYYQDQVTVSNHPVYSDPTYGAGTVQYGTTYSTATVSYPPTSGHTTTYPAGTTYSSGTTYNTPTTYSSGVYTTQSYPSSTYRTVSTSTPVNYRPRRAKRSNMRHYHGRFGCNSMH